MHQCFAISDNFVNLKCPEAEFYIATTFPGVKRIVCIGDPMQLNATVVNIDCISMGFGKRAAGMGVL